MKKLKYLAFRYNYFEFTDEQQYRLYKDCNRCRIDYSRAKARNAHQDSAVEYLDWSNSKLLEDSDLTKYTNLKTLSLSGNELLSLPKEVLKLSKLEIV